MVAESAAVTEVMVGRFVLEATFVIVTSCCGISTFFLRGVRARMPAMDTMTL